MPLLRWIKPRWWLPVAVLAGVWLAAAGTWVERVNLLVFDSLQSPVQTEPASTIVAIDEVSLAELGRWPWPRSLHAQLLSRLHEAGVSAVGYNVMFSEPSLEQEDAALADALRRVPKVVLPVAALADAQKGPQILQSLPAFREGAGSGLVDTRLDADGRWRRLSMSVSHGGLTFVPFPWAVLERSGMPRADVPGNLRHTADDRAADLSDQWIRDREVLLPPLAKPVPVVSFSEAMRHPQALSGRVVFVGVTAKGLGPEYVMTWQGEAVPMSSPVLMANAYEVLLHGREVVEVSPWMAGGISLLCLFPVLLWPLSPGRWSRWGPVLTLSLPVLTCLVLLRTSQWWFPPVAVSGVLAAAALAWASRVLFEATRETRFARKHAQATLAAVGEGVVVLDQHGAIHSRNPAAEQMSSRQFACGLLLEEAYVLDEDSRQALLQALASCRAQLESVRVPQPLRLRSGDSWIDVLVTLTPLPAARGTAPHIVLALRDVTATVVAGQQLQHAATHDALTGLPNRSLLMDRLDQAITRAERSQQAVAVLFMDLDRFKRINDSLGHAVGDEVLKEVSQRLQTACRKHDTVARWGGDEFVVILEGITNRESVITVVSKMVESVSQDLHLAGMTFPCTCSVGIVMAPQEGTDPDALLAMADAAMYRAKSQPHQRWEFFSSELNRWTRDRLLMESEARRALVDGGFELYYQPQVDMRTGELVGFEALLRWRKLNGSFVPTGEFIAMAEESQLILNIGEWTLREAARQIATWVMQGGPLVPVSVNVSARQCLDQQLVTLIAGILKETGIPPGMLKLEITETAAMSDAGLVEELLEGIQRLGVGIALDDFGTGYSSLIYLRRFPIQQIKIDRSFVQELASNPEDAAIVRAIIGLAHGLGVPVVAEGVETHGQREILLSHGCDILQGFLYARPMPAAQASHWVAGTDGSGAT